MTEKKKGLWANIHAKRKRGERPARPGEKGYPKTLDIEEAKKDTDMYTYIDQSKGQVIKGKSGTFVGYTHSATKGKGANILKHNQTKKYYAAGGSSTAFTQKTTLHDTPEDAARAYHKGNLAEASPMIKPPKNEFGKKEDAFAHAKQHGGKVFKKTFTHPTSGMQTVSYVVREDAEQIDELKRTTLANYVSKAAGSYGRDKQNIGRESPDGTVAKARPELKRAVKNRLTGINRAAERLAKEEAEIDEAIKKPNATTRFLRQYPVSDKEMAKPVKTQKYEMMHRNGQVRRFVAKDDADAKRIAAGHGAKSVIRLKGDVPAGKVSEGYTGRETKDGTWRVFKDGQAVAVAGPFKSRDEAHAWIKEKTGVTEETKKMKGKDPCWTGYKMIGTKEKGGKQVPNCVPVKEQMTFRKLREQDSKEVQEYDYEGDMARSDLRSIIMNAKEVHDMLESNTNLPEWVQSKITLSEDYISTVRNYMRSENDNV